MLSVYKKEEEPLSASDMQRVQIHHLQVINAVQLQRKRRLSRSLVGFTSVLKQLKLQMHFTEQEKEKIISSTESLFKVAINKF